VTNAQTGEPVPAVQAIASGPEGKDGANTGAAGQFTIRGLPPGSYQLIFRSFNYQTDTLTDLTVQAGRSLDVTAKLLPKDYKVEGVEITTDRFQMASSQLKVVADIEQSPTVDAGISQEQIANTQDRNAAQVVRRIPGISLSNSRYVMIRGLSPRYSSVLLNGVVPPSSDPNQRAFAFDILPSGMIDEIMVTKTGDPALPGDFAGGVVQIQTLAIPEQDRLQIDYKTSFRRNTTFSGQLQLDEQQPGDWLGDGAAGRDMPSSVPDQGFNRLDDGQRAAISRDFDNTWGPANATAFPNQSLSAVAAKKFELGDIELANTTSLKYSCSNLRFDARRLKYEIGSGSNGNAADDITIDTTFDYFDDQHRRSVRLGAVHNWHVRFNDDHTLFFNGLYNHQGVSQFTLRNGRFAETGDSIRNYIYRYRRRRIMTASVGGRHDFAQGRLDVNWYAGYALARNRQPDYRQLPYRQTDPGGPYRFTPSPTANVSQGGRFYSRLAEDTYTGRLSVQYELAQLPSAADPIELKAGGMTEHRSRDFSARWFAYVQAGGLGGNFNNELLEEPAGQIFADENVNDSTGYSLREGSELNDTYNAESQLYAGYAALSLPVNRFLSFYGGVRIEHSNQTVNSFPSGAQQPADQVSAELPVTNVLPSLNATFRLPQDVQLRAAYSMTLNRPQFREMAAFRYYDYFNNYILEGNDELSIARIHNADLRLEWYPNPGETVSFGLFGKRFQNPIEWRFIPGATDPQKRNYTFQNVASATAYGAEVEVRKHIWRGLSTVANAAYSYTRIDLGDQATSAEAEERPLQGQSPFLANAMLVYDWQDLGLQVAAAYNVFGKRVQVVGVENAPTIYEMPRHQLHLTVKQRVSEHFQLQLGLRNLLNAHYELRQDANRDNQIEEGVDPVVESYRRGQLLSLSGTLSF
jgi:outer membrane receptor protein involved in Fe transport